MLRLTVTLSETEAMEFLGAHWVSQRVDTPRYPIIGVPIETDPLTELFLETSSSETKVFGVHHFLHSLLPGGWKYRLAFPW